MSVKGLELRQLAAGQSADRAACRAFAPRGAARAPAWHPDGRQLVCTLSPETPASDQEP